MNSFFQKLKDETYQRLNYWNIPVHIDLPLLPEMLDLELRNPEEVAKRAFILHALLGVIFYENPKEVTDWVKREKQWGEITEQEMEVFSLPDLPELESAWKQKALKTSIFTWRAESLYTLVWALGKLEDMLPPTKRMEGPEVVDHIPRHGSSTKSFIQSANLRSPSDLFRELYFYLWIYVELQVAEREGIVIPHIEDFLITERLNALRWVCCAEEKWDE